MSEPRVLVERRDGIMVLTLNRPAKLNAIDNELAEELLGAIDDALRNEAVRVLLLRGAGRAFCAGRDVGAPPTQQDLLLVQAVAQAIVALPKPVIAAVHGWTVGAGVEWMLDADLVVAANDTRFRLPEASLGVFVTGGLTATLPASVGLARAKALMLLGSEFSAAQAQAWGMVWQVVDPSDLESASLRVAMRVAELRPDVAAQFKRVLNQVGMDKFVRAVALENEAQTALSENR